MTSRLSSLVAFGVLGALGALAWTGCGPGSETRYYCDGSGCFTCDAYGCSTVTPPAKQSCTGSSSCPEGSVCTASGCTVTCKDNSACPQGEVCQSGLCSAPQTTPGTAVECTTKKDCGDGKACVSGSCEACGGTAGPCPCTAATDCSTGQQCVAGSCTDPQNVCKFSSECGDGKVCADGQCLASCEAAPCADGFTCDNGACKPKPTTGCTTNADCSGATPQCAAGSCVKACTADAECGAGNYCNQGACAVDTRPKPNCTEDAQCGGTAATPKKCLGGFCKYTCTTDDYCRTIDSRIGYCAKDGVCRNFAEASAQCVASTDCDAGKSCVDNACK